MKYFEDQPLEEQAAQRIRRRKEIEAIGLMQFPVSAEFAGKPVTILGPVDRFSPYKEQAQGREDPNQLMVQPAVGNRFIALATSLTVYGRPLVARVLPLRERPNPFIITEFRGKPLAPSVDSEPAPAIVQPRRESIPPELMSPAEAVKAATVRFSGKDAYARFGKRERWLSPGSRSTVRAVESAHRGEIARALADGRPVSAAAIRNYGLKVPSGYGLDGERLVKWVPTKENSAIAPIRTATSPRVKVAV